MVSDVFISPFSHPKATAVDAMMADWNKWEEIYVFPPPKMLPCILDRLERYKGGATLIARVTLMDPLYPIIHSKARDTLILKRPPFQTVRNRMVVDPRHESCPWTAYRI